MDAQKCAEDAVGVRTGWLSWVGGRCALAADDVRQLVLHTTTRSLHSRDRPFLRRLVEGGRRG
jgi:hypothetical protein